jgi:hypothetical protein
MIISLIYKCNKLIYYINFTIISEVFNIFLITRREYNNQHIL